MAHAWWHIGTGPEYGTEEFYDQPGEPDVAAAMDWARIRAEQEGREPNWKDILAYWTTEDPLANPQALAARYEADRMGVSQEEAAYARRRKRRKRTRLIKQTISHVSYGEYARWRYRPSTCCSGWWWA